MKTMNEVTKNKKDEEKEIKKRRKQEGKNEKRK